jgi:hypothetical protein
MIKIAEAISSLNPKAAFSIENNDYSTIQWTPSHEGIKPTIEKVQAELARLEAEAPNKKAKKNRFRDYQKESDPLFFKWQVGEATEEQWKAKRTEIKARH